MRTIRRLHPPNENLTVAPFRRRRHQQEARAPPGPDRPKMHQQHKYVTAAGRQTT
jgi:hypothetical protein